MDLYEASVSFLGVMLQNRGDRVLSPSRALYDSTDPCEEQGGMLREAWGAAISFVRLAHKRAAGKDVVLSRVMSPKRGNKNYYKGKGVPSIGRLSRKGMSLGESV